MTTITINRATVEQALEAMRCAVPTGKITLADWHKSIAELEAVLAQQVKHVAWMRPWPPVRAQQAEQAWVCPESPEHRYTKPGYCKDCGKTLVQQAEPDHETRAELAEQQVVQLAEERDHYRNLWQKAQQAEPVEPVGRVVSANCEYATVQWLKQTSDVGGGDPKNSRSWPIAGDAVYTAPPQQAEPVAEARYDGTLRWLEPHGVGLHRIQGPLFTAPPQRKPLTDEDILRVLMLDPPNPSLWPHLKGEAIVGDVQQAVLAIVRAVERALEEKNRGR